VPQVRRHANDFDIALLVHQRDALVYRILVPEVSPRQSLADDCNQCGAQLVAVANPARVSLFDYDNDKFIVESFAEEPVQAKTIRDKRNTRLRDIETGQDVKGQQRSNSSGFETPLTRRTYPVFAAQ
jgi:hypothetical protein